MIDIEALGRIWEVAARQGWDYALARQAPLVKAEQDQGEALLKQALDAWWRGPAVWARLGSEHPAFKSYPYEASLTAVALLRGFLDGAAKVEAATHWPVAQREQ